MAKKTKKNLLKLSWLKKYKSKEHKILHSENYLVKSTKFWLIQPQNLNYYTHNKMFG